MTVGQRVAQKRKEQGLSQEALGEALGVSRQSVYKWESDSALPEIDKLIAMSRLFGVTVGWLLGVEETAQRSGSEEKAVPKEDGGKSETGELTETQLKMVEEIVDRYLAAQQPPPKRRRWPFVVAEVVILLGLYGIQKDLRNELWNMRCQYDSLRSSINVFTGSVDSQIEGITSRVEEALKSQNSLTASYGTEIVSADLAANTVTFSAYATPKTYIEGMTAVFAADNGVDVVEVPAELGAGQTFSARLTCGLTNEIDISVVFVTGDVRETQLLDSLYGLYSQSLPETDFPNADESLMWKALDANGRLTWSETEDYAYIPHSSSADSINDKVGRAEILTLRVGLFRNRKLLCWLEPCDRPAGYGDSFRSSRFYRFPNFSVEPEEGDEFRLCTVVEDEFHREFVYCGIPYVLDQEDGELTTPRSGEVGRDDPANWEY